MQVSKIPISELRTHPKNPRVHPDSAIEKLERSIKEFGWTNPILVSADGYILAGHARLKAAEKAGIKEVPVIYLPLEGAKAEAYLIADNRLQDETDWDLPKLKDLLQELDTGELDLELTGFDMGEIEDLMTQFHVPEEIIEDEVPEPPEEPITKPGDLWILGRHRLLCGDATEIEDVKRLISDDHIDLFYTDPPYGIEIVSSSGKVGASNLAETGTYKQIIGDDTTESAQKSYEVAKKLGIKNQIIWGGNYFTDFLPPSPCWLVWDKRGEMTSNNFADGEIAWTSYNKPTRIYKQIWSGMIKEGESGKRIHPTQKPIALGAFCFNNIAPEAKTVLDPFGGSGSTLIACEQLNRTCYMMEIDPVYCDVIIKRWENLTGQKAVLAE